jgi:alpha-tubulin suppressor-like RCC1 family protein
MGGLGGLGHGDSQEQARPKLVQSLVDYGVRVKQASCGEKHTVVLTDDGEVGGEGGGRCVCGGAAGVIAAV